MEFLDFLKYGAIGISLALAILSYRLLSKEQDKPEVRIPILNSIKTYFLLAVFLSVFFGSIEIITTTLGTKEPKTNVSIEKIWDAHFSDFPDSTLAQKTDRISKNIKQNDASDCKDIALELQNCKNELKNFDVGFYQNVIKLQNLIKKDADSWINLGYQTENKQDVIVILKELFRSLGENSDQSTDQEILQKWKSVKAKWTNDPEKMGYIFQSDIAQVVKLFLIKFSDEN
jgi:hypothetical protein